MEGVIGKTVGAVIGAVAMIGIAIAAPMLAPLLVGTLFGAAAVTATTVAIATAVIATALSVGVSLVMRALAPAPSTRTASGPPSVFRQTITNSFILYGKRRVGGLLVFFHSRKNDKKHYRYFVIAVAGHRCKGVVNFRLNDDIVTMSGALVTSGKYAQKAWLWFDRGEDTATANSTFVSECGGKWTSAHAGKGIAKIYAKFEMSDAVVESGMPNITADVEGKDDIFDPRTGTSGYTNNTALCFYDWMQIPREEGGFGAYDDEIPDDDWISAQANVCDEVVNSEPRYTCNGVITTGAAPSEVRDTMVINCAGSYTYSGGKHLMRPGYWVPVSATLSEDDLAGPIQVSPFMTGDVAANEVNGTYINPSDGYQAAALTTQTITPAPTDIRQLDIDLPLCTSKHQADRVAKIMLNRAQCEKSVVWPMNISGLKVKALDTVTFGTPRYSLSNYAFVITNWSLSPDWGVVINGREENEEIYGAPSVVAPVTPPTVDGGEAILTEVETIQRIQSSSVSDSDPADGLMQATSASITVEVHSRNYQDKSVSVTGATFTQDSGGAALTSNTTYHVYYDDFDRLGGAVDYKATKTSSVAATSPTNPGRHYVGTIKTDVSGGTGTSAGGQVPPGWNSGNYYDTDI